MNDTGARPAEAVWRALDLVVRRYAIGEAIAQEYPYRTVQRMTKQYVHLARLTIRP